MIQLLDGNTFLSHDLHLLESLELKQRIKHIVEIIEDVKWEDIDPDMLTRFVDAGGVFPCILFTILSKYSLMCLMAFVLSCDQSLFM